VQGAPHCRNVMQRTLVGATEEVVSKASTFGRDLQRLAD
jgi:hypothetical protein